MLSGRAAYLTNGRAHSTCGASWNAPVPMLMRQEAVPYLSRIRTLLI